MLAPAYESVTALYSSTFQPGMHCRVTTSPAFVPSPLALIRNEILAVWFQTPVRPPESESRCDQTHAKSEAWR